MSEQFKFSGWLPVTTDMLKEVTNDLVSPLGQGNIARAFATVTVLTTDGQVQHRELALLEPSTEGGIVGNHAIYDFNGLDTKSPILYDWITSMAGLSISEDENTRTIYLGEPENDECITVETLEDGTQCYYGI